MLWKIDELISYVSQFFTLKIEILFYGNTCRGAAVNRTTYWRILEGQNYLEYR
jgi:hypothetical protein